MKNKLLVICLLLLNSFVFLKNGCASTEKLLSEKSVIGMSKEDLLNYTMFGRLFLTVSFL